MESARAHRAKSAAHTQVSGGVEAVGVVSRILADQSSLLKAVVSDYEQCGVALEAACDELDRRDAAMRDVSSKLRRAALALKQRRPHSEILAIVNDALLSAVE